MSGTVNIARALFSHECFADEAMTEREAWVWLIMEASWKPRKRRMGDFVVDLERGQLAASVRFMAASWKWSAPRVQRFLKRVQNMEMICVKTDTGVTVITICKYDEYQSGVKAADTGPIQDRYTSDTKEKKDERREEGKEEERDKSLSRETVEEPKVLVDHFNTVAGRVGWSKVQILTPPRKAALMQRVKACGGTEAWCQAIDRAAMSPHLTGQNDRQWMADFDWLNKAANFTKLMEGNYDPRPDNPNGPNHRRPRGPHDSMVAAFAAVANRNPN